MSHPILEKMGFEEGTDGFWRCRTTGVSISEQDAALIFCQADVLKVIFNAGRAVGQRQMWHRILDGVNAAQKGF